MKKMLVALPMVALVAACGSGNNGSGGSAAQMKVVGSSTVYPFTTAVAEVFQRANPGSSVIVESTGTGAGIKLFCEGVGGQTPDMVNASRQMKAAMAPALSRTSVSAPGRFMNHASSFAS